MHLVAQAGYARQEELKRNPQPCPWTEIVDAYMTDFKRHADIYKPQVECRTSIKDELVWLESLKEVESASAARALKSGIFDQVRACDMERAAKSAAQNGKLQLRDGWLDLLSTVRAHNENYDIAQGLAVLSVNWSQEFIRQTLTGDDESRIAPWISDLPIYANEIPSIVEGNTNQKQVEQCQDMRTSGDKAKILQGLIEKGADALSVYVGDSSTDLECLTTADIGICMRDEIFSSGQKELAVMCDRVQLQVKPIASLNASNLLDDRSKPHLLWAANFIEIRDWLLRLQ